MNLFFPVESSHIDAIQVCGVRVIAQGEIKSSKLGGIHQSKWDIIAREICETLLLPMTHVQLIQISRLMIYTESRMS